MSLPGPSNSALVEDGIRFRFRVEAVTVYLNLPKPTFFVGFYYKHKHGIDPSKPLHALLLMIYILHYLQDPKTMRIIADSLLWVLQDLYHQP